MWKIWENAPTNLGGAIEKKKRKEKLKKSIG